MGDHLPEGKNQAVMRECQRRITEMSATLCRPVGDGESNLIRFVSWIRIAIIVTIVIGCALAQSMSAQTAADSRNASTAPADPSFEVAVIKPSNPSDVEWGLGTKGNHFWAQNATLLDLISFAYELHVKQIVGGPPWCRTERFDVEAVPDFEGRPLRAQLQTMLRKLLADRFQLKVHTEKKKLEVYALVVASGGVKFRKSDAPPDAHPGYNFTELVPVTEMKVMRMTMQGFASAMQRTVLDRPVIDETGLSGRYDFVLQWTPDQSQFFQFRGAGVHIPSGSEEGNAPPGLFTAIQNQLGLKLEAKKALDDVYTIDHVEKPSAN